MKRILSILLILLLSFSLGVSVAYAAENLTYIGNVEPFKSSDFDLSNLYSEVIIIKNRSSHSVAYSVYSFDTYSNIVVDGNALKMTVKVYRYYDWYSLSNYRLSQSGTGAMASSFSLSTMVEMWSTTDIYDADGNLVCAANLDMKSPVEHVSDDVLSLSGGLWDVAQDCIDFLIDNPFCLVGLLLIVLFSAFGTTKTIVQGV